MHMKYRGERLGCAVLYLSHIDFHASGSDMAFECTCQVVLLFFAFSNFPS